MSNNRKKYVMGGIAVALAGVLTFGAIATRWNNVEVQASPSLDGIEKIISSNSATAPFTILEIVPSGTVSVSESNAVGGEFRLSTGTVGWLISGNEPMRASMTLQQLKTAEARKDFMNNKLKPMMEKTKLINGDNGALTWVDYEEKAAESVSGTDLSGYSKFTPEGAQLVDKISLSFDSTTSGDYVKRYLNPDATGSQNTIAEDFFNKNDNKKLMESVNGGDFDPNFILSSSDEEGIGQYLVEFKAESGVKRGAFRATQKQAYTINVGGAWDDSLLPENTTLYAEVDGKLQFAGYLYKDADGNAQIDPYLPHGIDDYSYTARANDTIFKPMKVYAAENTVSGDFGELINEEEDPAGEEAAGDEETVSNDIADPAENPSENEVVDVPAAEEAVGEEGVYYTAVFEYTEDLVGDTEQLYIISIYTRMADTTDVSKRGIPYKIKSSEPIVSNYAFKGTITHVSGADKEPWICFEKTSNGNYKLSEGEGSYYLKGTDIYYKGGFINNDWFKKYVFDLDGSQTTRDNMNIQVYTVSAASVGVADIEGADLIYLSAGDPSFMPSYNGLVCPSYGGSLDISKEVSSTLLYQASMRNKPVMTDYKLISSTSSDVKASYAWKASYVLGASDIKTGYNKYVSSFTTDGITLQTDKDHTWVNKNVYIFNDFVEDSLGHTILNYNFITTKTKTSMASTIEDGLKEVQEKIQTTNDARTAERKITNTNITEATIIRHILDYSKVGALAAKDDIYILELEPSNMGVTAVDEHYGGSVTLQYDLSVKVTEVNGTKKNILQYCKHDNYTNSVKPENHEKVDLIETTGTIHLTQMGTPEFIGKIDDLNSSYDMIFIGDDSSGLNHRTREANTETKFNDATMNGLVYFNVGDYIYVERDRILGGLASEYKNGVITNQHSDLYGNGDYRAEQGNDPDTTIGRTRFSGNDIRESDIKYFYDYALADYPILCADNILTEDNKTKVRTVNEYYVDNCSNMCAMLEKILADKGTEDNLFRISDLQDNTNTANTRRSKLLQSLGILKPVIKFISPDLTQGDKWDVSTGSSLTGSDKNFIDVTFRIDDPGSGSAYTANAYIDLNADGKYAENEEVGGAAIRIYNSGSSEQVDRTNLSSGTEYRIVCELNDAPVGIYPWKLSVTQNGNKYRRDGKIAYFLAPTGSRDEIKVLQLKSAKRPGDSNWQTLDLEARMNTSNSILGKHLREARDFDLNIVSEYSDYVINQTSTKVKVTDVDKDGIITDSDYLALFDEYDMLIIGFADVYQWGNEDDRANEAAEALLQYMALGKSVLFCHDATSFYNYTGHAPDKYYWGYVFNQYIRSIVGMNRYGIYTRAEAFANSEDSDAARSVKSLLGKQHKDKIWEPSSRTKNTDGSYSMKTLEKTQSQGLAYHDLRRYRDTGHWKWNTEDLANYNHTDGETKNVMTYSRLAPGGTNAYTTVNMGKFTKVNVLNRGQITEYPYHLDDEISVMTTHSQYWQLNLDIDDDEDGESDVVVWYTLGDTDDKDANWRQIYSSMGKDARNNYFIYNKGNVVYSGQGHQVFTNNNYDTINGGANPDSTNESRLIVNTIIAAYAAGTRTAKIHFHENGKYTSKNITSDIIPYDALYSETTNTWEKDAVPITVSGNTTTDPMMTTYFEIDDSNVVDTKKIYVKFFKEDNATLTNTHTIKDGGDMDVTITPLTDEGVEVSGGYTIGRGGADVYNAYLLYDSTNPAHTSQANVGKMFKMDYSLKEFEVDSTGMSTVSNTPGIRAVLYELITKRKGAVPAKEEDNDALVLVRTRMFDLK